MAASMKHEIKLTFLNTTQEHANIGWCHLLAVYVQLNQTWKQLLRIPEALRRQFIIELMLLSGLRQIENSQSRMKIAFLLANRFCNTFSISNPFFGVCFLKIPSPFSFLFGLFRYGSITKAPWLQSLCATCLTLPANFGQISHFDFCLSTAYSLLLEL